MKERFDDLLARQDYLEECQKVLEYIQQIFECENDNKLLVQKLNDLFT